MLGIESVAIVVGIIKVIGNHVKKTCSLKIETYKKNEMLVSTTLNTISDLVSKALRDDTISDEEYTQISLEFEMFTRMNFSLKSKISLSKSGNVETEVAELLH